MTKERNHCSERGPGIVEASVAKGRPAGGAEMGVEVS